MSQDLQAKDNWMEDEDMKAFKANALSTVTFTIIRNKDDWDSRKNVERQFQPEMAHQVFGSSENIFGYRNLSIELAYLHNSAKCFVNVSWSAQLPENANTPPDNIMEILDDWLPQDYRTNVLDFEKDLQEEVHGTIYGKEIDSFCDQKGNSYKVVLCDHEDADFKDFHQRFETFIIWFIDGANYIDLDDHRWCIFYVYETYEDQKTKKVCHSPVGFCTVYKFFHYPNSTRMRISQFFILPTHQRRGVGTKFYSSIFKYIKELPAIEDITVEEPTPVFQQIRDFTDSFYIYNDIKEKKLDLLNQHKKKQISYLKEHRICSRQSQRILDILGCVESQRTFKEYNAFLDKIKTRISNEIERENRGGKRMCSMERVGVSVEPIDKKAAVEEAYATYMNSFEWPIRCLKKELVNLK